jgi:hypothetical protein
MDVQRFASYGGLFLAVAVAAALQFSVIARSPSVTADGIIFVSVAKDLSRAPIDAFRNRDQHPAYPAMLLASTRLVQAAGYRAEPGSWMLGGQIVAFICGLLSVWVVWLFARDLFDARVANLAAFGFAILPQPRHSASDAMSCLVGIVGHRERSLAALGGRGPGQRNCLLDSPRGPGGRDGRPLVPGLARHSRALG